MGRDIEDAGYRPEIIELVGVDGSGKSTLLRQLLAWERGIEAPRVGTITFTRPPETWFRVAAERLELKGSAEGISLDLMFQHALAWREKACRDDVRAGSSGIKTLVLDRHVIGLGGYYGFLGVQGVPEMLKRLQFARPSRAVLLNVPVRTCLERIQARGGRVEHHEQTPKRLEMLDRANRATLKAMDIPTLVVCPGMKNQARSVREWIEPTS